MGAKLGYVDIDKMLGEISWLKFLEWICYAELEPFGERRADYRSAQIAAKIHNIFAEKQLPISDFLLTFGGEEKKKEKKAKPFRTQTTEEQITIAYMIAHACTSRG